MTGGLLTAKDVARLLASSLSFVSKEVRLGHIECVRLGSSLRFTESAVQDYIRRNTRRVTSLVAVRGRRQ